MAVPKRKVSKGRRNRRRSHKALKLTSTVMCPKCGELKLPHRVCGKCGSYLKSHKVRRKSKSN